MGFLNVAFSSVSASPHAPMGFLNVALSSVPAIRSDTVRFRTVFPACKHEALGIRLTKQH
jgi:hypothetical protein